MKQHARSHEDRWLLTQKGSAKNQSQVPNIQRLTGKPTARNQNVLPLWKKQRQQITLNRAVLF